MRPNFHLVLLIHSHQPCGNFCDVFERAYQRSYLPFVELLERHSGIHLGLHYSGPLLEWIEEHHPEFFVELRALAAKGQIELIGGGFYEPILISIPLADQQEQITRMADYMARHFGRRPAGAWLAERVWEPQLPSALASAGVNYTLVDDMHFLAAGFEAEELFADYVAEDCGRIVRVLPGLRLLRYYVPFRPVPEILNFLNESAAAHPGGMAAMGDDCEKFGVWPGTYDHCYGNHWLEGFFTALEAESSWLRVSTPGEYLAAHPPVGRADLPAASYSEMMEWVLPTRVRQRYNAVQQEFTARSEVQSFLRGGPWRAFFRKYPEANLLHKKMLRVSAKLAGVPARPEGTRAAEELAQARTHLLRAQCNDAYWHGIFGGVYAPHLRTPLWKELIQAETAADRHTTGGFLPHLERADFDADGVEELVFSGPEYHALLRPADGGTLVALDSRSAAATLVNSMTRRPEAYHARLRDAGKQIVAGVTSIHDQVRVKEPGLENYLRYDRWPRHAFRLLLFDPARTQADYEALRLDENASFAGGDYAVGKTTASTAELLREDRFLMGFKSADAAPKLSVIKRFSFGTVPRGFEAACEFTLRIERDPEQPFGVGLESVINLLAPSEPDRFFETPNGRQKLRWSGILPGPWLRMEDGWQRLRVILHAPEAKEFWVAPIETVSESEEGFERVYQGSQILAVWSPRLAPQREWTARLIWRIESIF